MLECYRQRVHWTTSDNQKGHVGILLQRKRPARSQGVPVCLTVLAALPANPQRCHSRHLKQCKRETLRVLQPTHRGSPSETHHSWVPVRRLGKWTSRALVGRGVNSIFAVAACPVRIHASLYAAVSNHTARTTCTTSVRQET